jgi:hypothetical protein
MGSVCIRRGSRCSKTSAGHLNSPNRTLLFGQYVFLRTDVNKWDSMYLLLSNKDLTYSKAREDQSHPIEVIRFEDMAGIQNPQITSYNRRRSSTYDNVIRKSTELSEQGFPFEFGSVKPDCIRKEESTFVIITDEDGYFSGRPFYFEAADKFNRDLWIAYLSVACGDAFDVSAVPKTTGWTRFVRRLRQIYTGRTSQSCIGALVICRLPQRGRAPHLTLTPSQIMANFVLQVVMAQVGSDEHSFVAVFVQVATAASLREAPSKL